MALNIKESTAVVGDLTIDNVQVLYLSSNIVSDGSEATTFVQSILDPALYNANKAQCRAAVSEFQTYVYSVEDRFNEVEV